MNIKMTFVGMFIVITNTMPRLPHLWLKTNNLSSGHTTCVPEKFGNEALFLRLGLSSTRIRHENGAFRVRVDKNHFENGCDYNGYLN